MAFTKSILSSIAGQVVSSLLAITLVAYFILHKRRQANRTKPISLNHHYSRLCDAKSFFPGNSSYVAPKDDMERGLRLLKKAGMRKINFADGEPFLYPSRLAWLCQFCKEDLRLESVSIITNGKNVTKSWLDKYGHFVDVVGVSCDSFDERTNVLIGRGTGENVHQLLRIREWCRELGIKFKLNTVVCKLNWQEDMVAIIQELQPFRWKCFQVLFVEDENDASTADTALDKRKRDARKLLISSEQFDEFCRKHQHLDAFVPEPNDLMASSYLILDEYLCFLDKGSGKERQSRSILEVGVAQALEEVRFDQEAFVGICFHGIKLSINVFTNCSC